MINIKDKNLIYFLETVLNKKKEDITVKDFEQIKSINLNSISITDGTENKVDFSVLSLFPNLEEINIVNTVLSNKDLKCVDTSSACKLNLTKSTFDDDIDFSVVSKLEGLNLYNCYVDDYDSLLSNMNNLISLQIINPFDDNEINIKSISISIKKLVLDRCILKNVDYLGNFNDCEILSLLDTHLNGSNLAFFANMKNLKELYISDDYKINDYLYSLKDRVNIRYNLKDLALETDDLLSSKSK